MNLSKAQKVTILVIFLFIYGFLLSQIPWSLVFTDTMIAGGDTGSHNYIAHYAQQIFPKLKWWSPDWYAGFPFLYFYPPLLYYLTAAVSHFVPLNIVFKLVTLLGTLLLPVMVFFALRLLNLRFPIPSLGALFSLSYLFLEKFSIYGGNIPSTLAGEFSYSFAFAIFFLFIGLLVKGLREQRYVISLILVLSLMVLAHPFTVIVALFFSFLLLGGNMIKKKGKETFLYLIKVFSLSFCLTAFWSLPFIKLLAYSSKMSWTRVWKIDEIFPSALVLWQWIALGGLIYACFRKDKKVLPFIGIILAALIPFLILNHTSILNARFLPFILMGELLFTAYALGSWWQDLGKIWSRHKKKFILLGTGLLMLFSGYMVVRYIPARVNYIPSWEKWNYEGIENKVAWPELKELGVYLKSLPYGRVMWEYRGEYDKFGTPRVLENLPIWDQKPTFEGLLIESSLSGYFHFINQAETTKTPTSAIAGLDYPSFDFEKGVRHLQLFGAQYFIASTDDIKELADHDLVKLADRGEFSIYQVPRSSLVEVLPQIQLHPFKKGWLEQSIDWYKEMDFSHFLVFYHSKKEKADLAPYSKISLDSKKTEEMNSSLKIVSVQDDSLTFYTSYPNYPHLVKYTYFPGWQIEGGRGPYLVSPSFMLVIPTQNTVTLRFGYNIWDRIGMILSVISLLLLLFLFVLPKVGKLSRFALALKQKHLDFPL